MDAYYKALGLAKFSVVDGIDNNDMSMGKGGGAQLERKQIWSLGRGHPNI